MLYCQLNNNLLESFNSHQSVFDIQYTSVPSFPSAWLQSHCWELAGYRITQMVTCCAVCIKIWQLVRCMKVQKYTNEVKGVRSSEEPSAHCAFNSAGNCRKRKQVKIFQIKQHLDPLTAYNLSALFTAPCHQKEHIAV